MPMARFIRRACIIAALPLAASLPRHALAQETADYLVRSSAAPCLRVRDQPASTGTQVSCLEPGARVTGVESVPYWRRVRFGTQDTGWVAKAYLEIAPALADAPPAIPLNAWLEVHFVDVGQGDALWIHTHDDGVDGNGVFEGRNIVIDGGPDTWLPKNQIASYLLERAHPDAIIDALIVSHPHADHYYGARGLLREFQVRAYYDPGQESDNTTYHALLDSLRVERVNGDPARIFRGRDSLGTPDWGRELSAEFLYAWPPDGTNLGAAGSGTRVNNASIVLRLQYGGHSFLFAGDLEGKERGQSADTARLGEARVLADTPPEKLRATVLKASHHGSETSSTMPFLRAVNPEIVVISSGRRNFNGVFLPDNSVLARICSLGNVRVARTDVNDAAAGLGESNDADADHVVIRTNGDSIEVRAFSAGVGVSVASC